MLDYLQPTHTYGTYISSVHPCKHVRLGACNKTCSCWLACHRLSMFGGAAVLSHVCPVCYAMLYSCCILQLYDAHPSSCSCLCPACRSLPHGSAGYRCWGPVHSHWQHQELQGQELAAGSSNSKHQQQGIQGASDSMVCEDASRPVEMQLCR
jgi:hypothetical protein